MHNTIPIWHELPSARRLLDEVAEHEASLSAVPANPILAGGDDFRYDSSHPLVAQLEAVRDGWFEALERVDGGLISRNRLEWPTVTQAINARLDGKVWSAAA